MILDGNCMLGPRADGQCDSPTTKDQLLRDMDAFGIDQALVCSATARDFDPCNGNRELQALIEGEQRLFRTWTLEPLSCIRSPHQAFERLLESGAHAVIAYPEKHRFSLASWSLGEWLESISTHGIPLLIPRDQVEWSQIHSLAETHPDLPILITRVGYRELRFLYALWAQHSNLYIDLSWLSLHRGLEAICETGFVKQVVFGSYYPYYSPGGALGILHYAQLSADQLHAISSGNLLNILKWRGLT